MERSFSVALRPTATATATAIAHLVLILPRANNVVGPLCAVIERSVSWAAGGQLPPTNAGFVAPFRVRQSPFFQSETNEDTLMRDL
ncbi:hypothetical protein CKAH01_10652 [Colletotrichum kahawae]|uniref:Uncharacterized protein n=1 Tax=Colletotrichum kahawae TaxID=34407 RepID=A0AAE0CX95_COLKA|nr:hypothetical protein CKAH01_10652 [Colletotrichum kahawae]